MTHNRKPNWEDRLVAFAKATEGRPYKYGSWDCMLMSAAGAQAITGKDYGRGHRGKYKTGAGAVLHLKKLGFSSPAEMIDSLFEQKPIGFAQRGDVVLCKTDNGDNPGICLGDFVLLIGEDGPIKAGRELWLKAWAVGEQHADVPKKRTRKAK